MLAPVSGSSVENRPMVCRLEQLADVRGTDVARHRCPETEARRHGVSRSDLPRLDRTGHLVVRRRANAALRSAGCRGSACPRRAARESRAPLLSRDSPHRERLVIARVPAANSRRSRSGLTAACSLAILRAEREGHRTGPVVEGLASDGCGVHILLRRLLGISGAQQIVTIAA